MGATRGGRSCNHPLWPHSPAYNHPLNRPSPPCPLSSSCVQGVHVVASLPCYSADNVDAQRGRGVFERSIEGLRRLNAAGTLFRPSQQNKRTLDSPSSICPGLSCAAQRACALDQSVPRV
jgi:hypothetical protein